MAKIKVHEFVSLDGIYETPSWTADFPFDPKMGVAISRIMDPKGAILLGRKTYEMFYPAWSTRTADQDPGAPFFNETAKYVVSSTLTSAEWKNTTALGPYKAEAIASLKEAVAGDIYTSGSGTLVRAMLADDLVDEVHLFVFPVALGKGDRLFDGGGEARFSLLDVERYDSGVVHLAYGSVRNR